jgi:hypothetical protein
VDSTFLTVLKALETGGPYAMAAIAIFAAAYKNRECSKLSEKIMTIAVAQTVAETQVVTALASVKAVVEKYDLKSEKNQSAISKIELYMDETKRKLDRLEDKLNK